MRFRRYHHEVFIGLDLSPGRIKLVGVTEGDGCPRIVCAADEALRAGDDATRFDAAAVGAQVAALVSRLKVRPKTVALALGPGDAVARRLSVVDQEPRQMQAGIGIQLGQVLGGDGGAPRVGYERLSGPSPAGRVGVFAGAARPEALLAQQRAVSAAGLEQGPVTAAAGGLLEAWRSCRPRGAAAEARTVLLHVGESAAVWVVLDGDEPVALDAPLVGLASARDRAGRAGGETRLPASVLGEWVTRIHQEIARGLQSARRESGTRGEPETYEIWVSGGGSRVPGFHERLASVGGVRVSSFDPFRELESADLPGDLFGPALVPALGAALQGLAADRGTPRGFDLRLAPEPADVSGRRVPVRLLAGTLASDPAFRFLWVLLVAGCVGAVAFDARVRRAGEGLARREARVQADSAQVAGAMSRTQLLDIRRRALGSQVETVRALHSGRLLWPQLLAGLAAALPPMAWISDVVSEHEDPATGAISYRVFGYAAADAVASAFAQGLIREAAAAEARVERTSLMKIGRIPVVYFEISASAAAAPESGRGGGR